MDHTPMLTTARQALIGQQQLLERQTV